MATGDRSGAQLEGLDAQGLRIAVVAARWNRDVVDRLLEGVERGLDAVGVSPADRSLHWVPGSFEIPLAAQALARRDDVDAVITLGSVIRGETVHFDLVAGECARGVARVQLDTGVPVAFGVLTTEDRDQAYARSEGPGGHNVGEECVAVAVEMVQLMRSLRAH